MTPQEQQLWIEGLNRTPEQKQRDAQTRNRSIGGGIPVVGAGANPVAGTGGFGQRPLSSSSTSMPSRGVGGQGGQGRIAGVGNWLKDNASWLAPTALGVWSAFDQHRGDRRAEGLEDRAIAFREQQYRDMAPLRERAMERLATAERPDLAELTYDEGNPYSRSRRIPRVGRGA